MCILLIEGGGERVPTGFGEGWLVERGRCDLKDTGLLLLVEQEALSKIQVKVHHPRRPHKPSSSRIEGWWRPSVEIGNESVIELKGVGSGEVSGREEDER